MSIRVAEGTVVTLVYRLQTESGDILEDRTPENPFRFEFGKGQTLPAIENIIRGKTEGFEASLGVAAKEAYGEYSDELVATVPLTMFPRPEAVSVGMKFTTRGPEGEEITVRVVEVGDDEATVDGNHPLAGIDIEIDLRIVDISATDEETLSGIHRDVADAPTGELMIGRGFGGDLSDDGPEAEPEARDDLLDDELMNDDLTDKISDLDDDDSSDDSGGGAGGAPSGGRVLH